MKTPRRRDSGVSLGRFISFKNPPLPPSSKVGLAETPQQRLWGIENLNKAVIMRSLHSAKRGDIVAAAFRLRIQRRLKPAATLHKKGGD